MKRTTLILISAFLVAFVAGILLFSVFSYSGSSHHDSIRDGVDHSVDLSAAEISDASPRQTPDDLDYRNSRLDSDGVELMDPYRKMPTLEAAIDQMVSSGDMDDIDAAAVLLNWADSCFRAVGVSDRAARGHSVFGLTATFANRIHAFCRDIEEDFDGDSRAYKEALEDIASERLNPFMQQAERDGVNLAMAAALETVSHSVNEAQVLNALTMIATHTELESPFAGVDNLSVRPLFQGRLLYHDLPLAIVCDNLGGCDANHPLVARHCLLLEMHDGCYEPRDIYHALEQTQTPIQQTLFRAFKDQIWTMVVLAKGRY
jgi:hypothetical protein